MQIVVHQLTRMGPGRVCVAGLDVVTGRHVRPVLNSPGLAARLADGGPFALGARVDLGLTRPCPSRPRREDVAFDPALAHRVGMVDDLGLWMASAQAAGRDLRGIFGEALEPLGPGMACRPGEGEASLGVWMPPSRPTLSASADRVRLRVTTRGRTFDFSVTDRRFWMADHRTPNHGAVDDVARRIAAGAPVLLGIGLANVWEGHMWLQVNSVLLGPPGVH